jgi:hypothetical protein|nr:hypothetical protein [uncultured Psychroserpens sp.]
MKKLLYILISFSITFSGYSQKKNDIKKLVETETTTTSYSNGKQSISTKKITETEFNIYGKKMSNIRTTFHNGNPYKTTKTTYIYNEENKIDYEMNFIEEDSIHYTTYYNYENDNLSKIYSDYIYNGKHNKYQQNYIYNTNNKIINSSYSFIVKDIQTSDKLRDLKAELTFDKNERLIKSNWLQSDNSYLNNLIIHIRNKKGMIIKEKEYDLNNDLVKKTKLKYKFDNKNHWIVKKVYEKNILKKTTYREIEYFN